MEIVKVGKNTKNTEIKINADIKKAFQKYLKAQIALENEEYNEITIELLFTSWLNTFSNSEDYKEVIAAAEKKAADEKSKADAIKQERKAEREAAKEQKRLSAIEKKKQMSDPSTDFLPRMRCRFGREDVRRAAKPSPNERQKIAAPAAPR